MKLALSLAVLIALAPCAVLAAPKQPISKEASTSASQPKDCSTIKSTTVRQACVDRQAAENPTQTQGDMSSAVEKMKREDDLLAQKLKGICRGC